MTLSYLDWFGRAPVVELVDATDSKSVILGMWEFESPRGHQIGLFLSSFSYQNPPV